jgi:hypothetical protein
MQPIIKISLNDGYEKGSEHFSGHPSLLTFARHGCPH